MTAPVEALIFDMDGTMIDSMPWHGRSWSVFTERHGLILGADEILLRTTGRTGVECMRELLGPSLSDADCEALVHEKENIYRELFTESFTEVAGFAAFANAAATRGLKLAVGTAGDRHNIAFAMARLPMNPPPLAIVGGDEGFSGKPTPAIFLEAARRIDVRPERCIVFEDAPFGIEAAHRAGMRAVAICSSHPSSELGGPHVIAAVRDYDELIDKNFLETLNVAVD